MIAAVKQFFTSKSSKTIERGSEMLKGLARIFQNNRNKKLYNKRSAITEMKCGICKEQLWWEFVTDKTGDARFTSSCCGLSFTVKLPTDGEPSSK